MKHQTTTRRALALRKTTATRKRQRGFAMEWIVIVLLVIAALVPVVMFLTRWLTGAGTTIGNTVTANKQSDVAAAADQYAGMNQAVRDDMDTAGKTAGKMTGFGDSGDTGE